jgi:hypothetical protein
MWENKGIKLARDHYIMTHPERGKLTFLIRRREILYLDPVMTSLPQTLCFFIFFVNNRYGYGAHCCLF